MQSAGKKSGDSQERETALRDDVLGYLTYLRIERGSAENTLASYQRDLRRYGDYLAARGIGGPAEVDEGHIAEFLQALTTGADGGRPLAERSAARVLSAVRGLHKHWAQEGRTRYDPAAQVTAPKLAQSLPKALPLAEVTRLLETPAPSTPLGLRDRALLEFLYASGARISEAVALDVDDLHALNQHAQSQYAQNREETDGVVVVRVTGKGNKQRMVPLGRYAQQAIGDYLTASRPALVEASAPAKSPARRRGTAALFLNRLGSRLSRQSAWTVLTKTAEAAGITAEVSPHTLRHSCATHMLEGGADIRTVQELLGHASVTTTQIYTKVTAESLQETYMSAHPRAL